MCWSGLHREPPREHERFAPAAPCSPISRVNEAAPKRDEQSPGERLARVQRLAYLLDTAVRIPWTPIRFGVDSVIGLVPGLGDAVGAAMSGYIMYEAARLGASKRVLLRMLYNVGLDVLAGVIPIVGDLVDVVWRANDRNVRLLERHIHDPAGTKSATGWFFAAITAALAGLVLGTLGLAAWLVALIIP